MFVEWPTSFVKGTSLHCLKHQLRSFFEMTLGASFVPSWTPLLWAFEIYISYLTLVVDFKYPRTMELLTVQGNASPMASSTMLPFVNPDVSRGVGQSRPYMTSIGDIPADILYTIAQFADSLRDLVFVCKRWRDIVLFAPSLWKNIHITFPKAPPLSSDLDPERMARAALRRAGPTTRLSLHLEMHEISRNIDSATAVVDMISSRGHQFIRELTLDGSWFPPTVDIPMESISSLFSHLVGEWKSLFYLHLGAFPRHARHLDTAVLPFLDSIISTAPALRYIGISPYLLSLIEKKLSRKPSLTTLDILRSFLSFEPYRFSLWPHIKSLKIRTIDAYQPPIRDRLDLRATDPLSSAEGDISAFPLLTHAVFTHHTLEFCSSLRWRFLTDLVLSWVSIEAMAPHSVEMPLLRSLVAEKTRQIYCIIAPMLETLSIGPLPEPVNVGHDLSILFSGHPQQLDPVHLDLRPIYQNFSTVDTTVPLASVYLLKRVERISISRLSVVRGPDRWKYRMLESMNIDEEKTTKYMIMLPKWKEMDLGDDVPEWLWDVIIARQVAGFPVHLNLAD